MNPEQKVKEFFKNIDENKVLKLLNYKLIDLANNIDYLSVDEIVKYLSTDVNLVSKILKIVNSPFWGLKYNVTSIKQAIVLLGRDEIKRIIYTSMLIASSDNANLEKEDRLFLLKHSFITAELNRIFYKDVDAYTIFFKNELFLLGLLHDIGKILMLTYIPNLKELIPEFVQNKDITLEREKLGLDHALVGGFFMRIIGYPNYEEVIKNHHSTKVDQSSTIYRLLGLSDLISYLFLTNESSNELIDKLDFEEWPLNEYISINKDKILETISELYMLNIDSLFE